MVTSTKGKKGSFKRLVSSVVETIKSKFVPSSEKVTYDTTSGTATAGISNKGDTGTSGGGGSYGGTSGGGGGDSPYVEIPSPTPTPDIIRTTSGGVTTTLSQTQEQLRRAYLQAGYNEKDINILSRRAEMIRIAKERGRPFTRVEGESFLGGGSAIKELREATRKGGRYGDFYSEGKVEVEEVKQVNPYAYYVEVPEEKKGLRGLLEKIKREQAITQTSVSRGDKRILQRAKLLGLGVGSVLVETPLFIKQLVTKPVETIKELPAGISQEATMLGAGLQSGTPEFSLGRIGGFVVVGKGIKYTGKGVLKVVDIKRTRGAIEVPPESVIAPEYFKGQTYPSIRRGQTAGQLLAEFKPSEQYGVTRLRGFTASAKPFESVTEAGGGASEIRGVYQAPKVSPQFLRLTAGERTLFSLNPFETLKPSVIKINPRSFELVEGVRPTQTTLTPLSKAQKFFKEKAEIGKSYEPFIKTEKEAIIPEGTPLELADKRFYFTFEGRRIPIYEFEIGDLKKGIKTAKTYSTKEVSQLSSSGRVGSRSLSSPSSLISIPKSYSLSSVSKAPSSSAPLSSSISSILKSSQAPSYTPSSSLSSSIKSSVSSYPSISKSLSSSTPSPSYAPSSSPSFIKSMLSVLSSSGGKRKGKLSGLGSESFDVGVIKGGKSKIVKRGLNLPDARDLGAKKVLESLRATFFLQKSKQKAVDVPDTNIFMRNRDLFRSPKPNSNLPKKLKNAVEIHVQKKRKTAGRGSRLGTKPEVQEISLFGKGKKSSKYDWFM